MSKWIDADALKERYKEVRFKDGMTERIVRWLVEVNIDEAPSIDIVRCKECKYRSNESSICDKMNRVMLADDFCSYGERRE